MSEAPFVNFYTSDFLGGTGGMTAATKGVYITLLCLIYEAEKPLTQSRDAIARRCGCTVPAFEKALAALVDDGKIQVVAEGIWSEKCEKHIASRCDRRNSAKAAAEKRWQKSEEIQGKPDAQASNPQCKPEPEPEIEDTVVSSMPRKRASRLPETWVLPVEWGQWAVKEGWPEAVIRSEADRFRDYWIGKSGKDATKADWAATWRNWMRNSKAPKLVNGDGYERPSKSAQNLHAFIGGAD